MSDRDDRRRELGAFLRKRRDGLVRADFDLPPIGRARTLGLRREEIAYRSGVSVTWYTWLEQGREINASRQVLDAIARNMRLSAAEHEYVLGLAGYAATPGMAGVDGADGAASGGAPSVPAHLQRLLDEHHDAPAFAITSSWSIAAWNAAYEALYPGIALAEGADRNLLWLIFTDPAVRELLPDWATTSRHFLAEYRAEAGPLLGQPAHVALVDRLLAASAEFRTAWEVHEVRRFESRSRTFRHPAGGLLTFEHHRLTPSDAPDVHVVVYVPDDTTDTRSRWRAVLGR